MELQLTLPGMEEGDRLLTLSEAAHALGMSERQVADRVKKKLLPVEWVKVKKTYCMTRPQQHIPASAVAAYRESLFQEDEQRLRHQQRRAA